MPRGLYNIRNVVREYNVGLGSAGNVGLGFASSNITCFASSNIILACTTFSNVVPHEAYYLYSVVVGELGTEGSGVVSNLSVNLTLPFFITVFDSG